MKQCAKEGHILREPQQQRACRRQRQADGQHHFRVHGKPTPAQALFQHLPDHQKTDTAKEYQQAGDQIQQHIIPVGDQILHAAQNIKPRIIKGSYGVKQADAQGA